MKINELVPYKSNLIYKKAKKDFPKVGSKKELGGVYERSVALDKFVNYLTKRGFKKLGQGSFGATFIHPSYAWVFKLFYDDPAYFKFFEFVRRNQSNPHLPKIKGKYIKIADGVYVVRLEKLEKVNWAKPEQELAAMAIDDMYDIQHIQKREKRMNEISPLLYKTFMDITKLLGKNEGFDMHSGNYMFRGDTIVIIDPIFDKKKLHAD